MLELQMHEPVAPSAGVDGYKRGRGTDMRQQLILSGQEQSGKAKERRYLR